jgi:hypothetical protein
MCPDKWEEEEGQDYAKSINALRFPVLSISRGVKRVIGEKAGNPKGVLDLAKEHVPKLKAILRKPRKLGTAATLVPSTMGLVGRRGGGAYTVESGLVEQVEVLIALALAVVSSLVLALSSAGVLAKSSARMYEMLESLFEKFLSPLKGASSAPLRHY